MSLDVALQRLWYSRSLRWQTALLLPLSWLFIAIVALRRAAYASGIFASVRVARPVVIVGNITVGGTGKTPFTIWLARALASRGHRVGIVLRGYGGTARDWPRRVRSDTPWQEVGDEAVLLAQATAAIVVAGPDRVAAATHAIEQGADIVVADDGLQHYRLQRDCEILVIDTERGFGNGQRLPAGPLREAQTRLAEVDVVVATRRGGAAAEVSVPRAVVADSRVTEAVSLANGRRRALEQFRGQPVHAVAAIGNPQGFFSALTARGLEVRTHAYPDHAPLTADELSFGDGLPVLMTEKDAVRCRALADAPSGHRSDRYWFVPLEVILDARDAETILAQVTAAVARASTAR
jgi:tetraacyldisaccharide 4'-kinase